MKANIVPQDASNKALKWISSNGKVATVNKETGLVTFTGVEGKVTITAQTTDGSGVSAFTTIEVVKNVTTLRTPEKVLTIQKDKTLTIPVALDDSTAPSVFVNSHLTWKSSKPKVLSVNRDGRIRSSKNIKKKTKVKITVTSANKKSLTITVYVVPKSVKLQQSKLKVTFPTQMKVESIYKTKVSFTKAIPTTVKIAFTSSKTDVISVDRAGKLVALRVGKATITVTAFKKTGRQRVKMTIAVK
jgi:uncharacterized protein YjdB